MGINQVGSENARAVFLDRDGVLNVPVIRDGRPFPPVSLEAFELYGDVPAGCARLKEAGFLLVVVTNQPDVGRGTQSRAAAEAMNVKLKAELPMLDRVEVCFHAGEAYGEICECRKPKPGMLLRVGAALQIDFARSFMIGDRWRDIDCAHAAGCQAVFISRGYDEPLRETPDAVVTSFAEAVAVILARSKPLPL